MLGRRLDLAEVLQPGVLVVQVSQPEPLEVALCRLPAVPWRSLSDPQQLQGPGHGLPGVGEGAEGDQLLQLHQEGGHRGGGEAGASRATQQQVLQG